MSTTYTFLVLMTNYHIMPACTYWTCGWQILLN